MTVGRAIAVNSAYAVAVFGISWLLLFAAGVAAGTGAGPSAAGSLASACTSTFWGRPDSRMPPACGDAATPARESRRRCSQGRLRNEAASEAKLQLGFELLSQAVRWKDYATSVYIAVPNGRPNTHRSDGRAMAMRVVKMLGLGCLEVKSLWPLEEQHGIRAVDVAIEAAARDELLPYLRDALRPGHQTHAKAGTNRGGQFTRFRATCEALGVYAADHPGAPLSEALEHVDHHYASVRSGCSALGAWASKGKVHGVDIKLEGRRLVVYPTTPTEAA